MLQKPLPSILAEIELVSEFLDDLNWVVVLKNFNFLDVFAVQLDLKDADRLLDDRQEAGKWPLEGLRGLSRLEQRPDFDSRRRFVPRRLGLLLRVFGG